MVKKKLDPKIGDKVFTLVKDKSYFDSPRFHIDYVTINGILKQSSTTRYFTSRGKRYADEIFLSIKDLLQSLLDDNNIERDYRAKRVSMILSDFDSSHIKD